MSPTKEGTNSKKRKRVFAGTTANTKRARPDNDTNAPREQQPNPASSPTASDEDLCPAREILKENKGKYLIAWEDNPITGEKYKPTWEPKANANDNLVREWSEVKAAKKASKNGPAKSQARHANNPSKRVRRIIESSPTPAPSSSPQIVQTPLRNGLESGEHSVNSTAPVTGDRRVASGSPAPTASSPPHTIQTPLHKEPKVWEHAGEVSTPTDESARSLVQESDYHNSPAVEIVRPAGFDPAEYDRFSTQHTALTSSSPEETSQTASSSTGNGSTGDPTTPQSAALSTPSKVIPDSQGPSDSYIVSTQTASEAEQSNPSQLVQYTDITGTQAAVQTSEDSFQPAQIIPASSYPASTQNEDQSEEESTTKTRPPLSPEVQGTQSPSNHPDRAQASLNITVLTNSTMEMSPPTRPVTATPTMVMPASSDAQISARSLCVPRLEEGEFIVPLLFGNGMPSLHYQDKVRKFIQESTTAGLSVQDSMRQLLSELRTAEFHMELSPPADGPWTQVSVRADNFAIYSSNVSPKFEFLQKFLSLLREEKLHVILLASDQSLAVVEVCLQGKDFQYDYPSEHRKSTSENTRGQLKVTIISTEKPNPVVSYADLIICLDPTYDIEQTKKLRCNHLTNPNNVSPIIHPVIHNTSEHVSYCIRSSIPESERLRISVNCVCQLYDKVGEVPDSFRIKSWNDGVGRMVAQYVKIRAQGNGTQHVEWNIPSIGSIKESLQLQDSSTSSSSSISKSPQEVANLKRPIDNDTLEASKKMRMTPQPQDSPNPGDVTRIGDSLGGFTQPQSTIVTSLVDKNASEATQLELEAVKAELKSTKDRLRVSQSRHNELVQSIEAQIKRTEQERAEMNELREQFVQIKAANELLTANKARLQSRLEKKDEELTILNSKWELERNNNLTSQDSIVAEIASLRAKLEEAEAAKEKISKSYNGKVQEFEYLTNSYQSGASTAMEQANNIKELETKNAMLARKASDERLKMQEAYQRKSTEHLKKQLEAEKRDKALITGQLNSLRKQHKSLLETRGVGMGTRATSVPRSPRVGANGGSRAASPLPGSSSRIKALKNG